MDEKIKALIAEYKEVLEKIDILKTKSVKVDFVSKNRWVFDRKFKLEDLYSPSRRIYIVIVRHCMIYILKRKIEELTLEKLAMGFNRRDHTTILHALQKVEDMIFVKDAEYLKVIKLLEEASVRIMTYDNKAYVDVINNLHKKKKSSYANKRSSL